MIYEMGRSFYRLLWLLFPQAILQLILLFALLLFLASSWSPWRKNIGKIKISLSSRKLVWIYLRILYYVGKNKF